jgi:hypothetical protein
MKHDRRLAADGRQLELFQYGDLGGAVVWHASPAQTAKKLPRRRRSTTRRQQQLEFPWGPGAGSTQKGQSNDRPTQLDRRNSHG